MEDKILFLPCHKRYYQLLILKHAMIMVMNYERLGYLISSTNRLSIVLTLNEPLRFQELLNLTGLPNMVLARELQHLMAQNLVIKKCKGDICRYKLTRQGKRSKDIIRNHVHQVFRLH